MPPILVLGHFDSAHLLAEPQQDAFFTQMVIERLDYLGVDKRQQTRALVHHRHANTERRKNARVFASDHAGADNGERQRKLLELQNIVAGIHAMPVHRHRRIARGLGSDRHHHLVGGHQAGTMALAETQVQAVRVDERGLGVNQLDSVAQELMAHHVDFVANHRIDPHQEVLQRNLVLDLVRFAVDRMFAIAGQVEDGFAHGLARDGAHVNADASHQRLAFDQHHALSELGGLNCCVMAGGPRANHHQVKVKVRHSMTFGDNRAGAPLTDPSPGLGSVSLTNCFKVDDGPYRMARDSCSKPLLRAKNAPCRYAVEKTPLTPGGHLAVTRDASISF
jgi:hypothetical protein